MRYSATLVLAAATISLAQTSDIPNYKSALDIEIQPNSVDEQERWSWCNAQYNTCRTLCDNDTKNNECEQSDLSFDCKCTSNGTAPGLEYYTQTMPTFICKAAYEQCVVNHTTQKDHDLCEKNIDDKCGKTNPPAPKKGSTSDDDDEEDDDSEESSTSSVASSTTSSESSTGTADNSEASSTTDSDDSAAPTTVPRAVAVVAAMGVLAYFN